MRTHASKEQQHTFWEAANYLPLDEMASGALFFLRLDLQATISGVSIE